MQSQQQSSGSPSAERAVVPAGESSLSLFSGHRPAGDRYNEFCSSQGEPRPAWKKFCQLVDSIGADDFQRRWSHSQRLIYENGISYSAYGDPESNARPYQLDPLPLLIDQQEWEVVGAGVAQRAKLLRLVLADLLGPQRLIREGILPAEVQLAHPGYRLAYHGQSPPEGNFLQFYAADLGRSPNGAWWVLADRTEAPSGIGFALENRVVLSRMLPEVFRLCNVQRLAPFFIALNENLQRLAPANKANPRIVIYSRGPEHRAYFEDAYLARYLGHTLVQGDDLAVRDDAVWVKTLDGLLPVDVMVRRPNSEMCDPLEFDDDSSIGVAGLLQSCRHGKVAVSNSLGSGLVESPVFMAFMPRLCKFLLGEKLQLPGVATWWCGESASLERVLSDLDSLEISYAYRRRGDDPNEGKRALNALSPAELRERVLADPSKYVAQEKLRLAAAPAWDAKNAKSKTVVLRSFAVADGRAYAVMPGGLVRTSELEKQGKPLTDARVGSKDAWILGAEPVEYISLLPAQDKPVAIRRTGADLPSRVADNIYWLGRQVERADASARLLRSLIMRLTSETPEGAAAEPDSVLRALASQGQIDPGFALDEIKGRLPQLENALPELVFDQQEPGSLRSVVDKMFRLGSLARDRISNDTWRVLVGIDQKFRASSDSGQMDLVDLLNLVNGLIVDLAAFQGMFMESMTRSQLFHFLDIGRRLERALQINGLLRCCFVDATHASANLLESVLEIADSLMTYRSRYLANLQTVAVLDLLLTDETNPRSIAYQLNAMQRRVELLPRDRRTPDYLPHERLVMSLSHSVRMTDIHRLTEMYNLGERGILTQLLDSLDRDLPLLSNEIANRYLVHAGPSRRMSSTPFRTDPM